MVKERENFPVTEKPMHSQMLDVCASNACVMCAMCALSNVCGLLHQKKKKKCTHTHTRTHTHTHTHALQRNGMRVNSRCVWEMCLGKAFT